MKRIARRIRAGAFAVCLCSAVISLAETPVVTWNTEQDAEALEVSAILRRLGQTYSTMAAYNDRGVSKVRSIASPELNTTQQFATHFERSRYFSWTSDLGKKDDYRITFDGVRVVEQWRGRQRAVRTLGDAIASATGISDSASFWVPTLLMPEMIPRAGLLATFGRSTSPAQLANAEVSGRSCFVLRAEDPRLEVRVWISKRDFIIRRIEHRFLGKDAITTTDYSPQTDISLAP